MAREMTPQERAAVLLASLKGWEPNLTATDVLHDKHRIVEFTQATRRAALLECVQQLREGARLAQSREVANALSGHAYTIDRLAQEGASSIDLSPTIKDDGGYGEHF